MKHFSYIFYSINIITYIERKFNSFYIKKGVFSITVSNAQIYSKNFVYFAY